MLLRLAAALVAASMLAPAVLAQTYPSKTVTLVVPFPAGGSTDWLSRLLGQKLEQRLKHPFIVENRAGGANVIAATAVAKAEPDGHTLLMTTSTTMAINVSVFKNLPYDPDRDFAPVGLVSGVPFVLIVNAALPVRTVGDLVQLAKSKTGGLDYVSTGPGSAANLFAVLLKNCAWRHRHDADPLQGQCAGPAGCRRRARLGDVLRPAGCATADRERQGARARRLDLQAQRRRA